MATRSVAEVADELYALVPDEFIAARDAAAKQARDERDAELAAEIKQFRRPPVGAWLVNNLVRNDDGRLDDLFDLGAALREAQEALDGAELRAMSRQRHQLVQVLSGYAVELAGQRGHKVAESARRDVEATLEAALADADAEQAVRTGRLLRPLASTGLEAVDLVAAVAAPDDPPAPRARRVKPKATAGAKASAPAAKRDARAERAAAAAVRDARAALERAEAALAEQDAELAAARDEAAAAHKRVTELDAALAEATQQQSAAEQRRRQADQARRTASRARDSAQRELDAATRKSKA